MSNVRKFSIAIFVFVVICYASATETAKHNEADDGIKLRWRRHSKESENTSGSVKTQKHQKQEDSEAITRSQLTSSPSYAVIPPNYLAPQMRQMDNIFSAGGVSNYAYNYGYPGYTGYPSQALSPIGNPSYLYGNPNTAFNGGVQSIDQANNNLIGLHPVLHSPNVHAANLIDYGTGQPGLPQGRPLAAPQPFPPTGQPGLPQGRPLAAPQPSPPAYGNKLIGFGFFPNGEQLTNPITPSGFPNLYGQSGQIPVMAPLINSNYMG